MALYAAIAASVVPSRDRVIDFGKHRGRMLGTLPSRYLTWVSRNLRARDWEEWARAADEVLRDPIYQDRVEWESAERVLSGEGARGGGGGVAELLEISERFGWDCEDREGWGRVDLELLGTSKGGRIPRRKMGAIRIPAKERKVGFFRQGVVVAEEEVVGGDGREERRRRQRNRREQKKKKGQATPADGGGGAMNKLGGSNPSPFPGRDALLSRIRKRH